MYVGLSGIYVIKFEIGKSEKLKGKYVKIEF